MSDTFNRVALFIDYENFLTGLRQRHRDIGQPYGATPRLDFEKLVDFVTHRFGPLARPDFVAVANFTHFNPQKGGLNRVATLVDVDSFKHRLDRRADQTAPGKLHVVPNYADMRLAYEIGRHAAQNPADLYLLSSGDGAFSALGVALRDAGHTVIYLLADPDKSALLIKDNFLWFDVEKTGAVLPEEPDLGEPGSADLASPGEGELPAPVLEFLNTLSTVRQRLSCPVPLTVLEAIYGITETDWRARQAHGRGLLDLWEDPNGIRCASLTAERLQGKIYKLPVRPGVAFRAAILGAVQQIASARPEPHRAFWRRALKEQAGLSVQNAKIILNELLTRGILRDGQLQRVHLDLPRVLAFMQAPSLVDEPPAGPP